MKVLVQRKRIVIEEQVVSLTALSREDAMNSAPDFCDEDRWLVKDETIDGAMSVRVVSVVKELV